MPTEGSTLANPTKPEWRKTTVGDCIIINPDAYSPKEAWPFINYLDTGSVTENLVSNIQRLTPGEDKIPTRARRKVNQGDIVYSTVRPNQKHYGVIKDVPDNFLASTGFAVIRAKQGVADTGFIYYFLTQAHIIEHLHIIAEESMTAYPAIRPSDIARLEIHLPPLPTQRAIARILGAFDDKIALNARMNATLEAMAQALFQAWFVNFEPVRAKRSGQWRPGQTLPGMPAALYDLFPAELTPTELGDAPVGWEAHTIGDCYNLTMGQAPPGKTYNEDGKGMPFFQGRSDFGFRYPTNRKFCTAPKRLARPDDTLVSLRVPIGSLNMAYDECCIGRGVAALRHKSGSSAFTYYSVWSVQWELQRYELTGTVFGAVTKKQFEAIPILEPPIEVINAFGEFAHQWDKRIRLNTAESRTLADMRDTLLPKLLSGEVRVG